MHHSSTRQLEERLRAAAEQLPAGTKLPTVRELVSELRVSPVTVRRVVAHLVSQGLLETRTGVGTYVARRPDRADRRPDYAWQSVALGSAHPGDAGLGDHIRSHGSDLIHFNRGFLDPTLRPQRELAATFARAARRPGAWDPAPPEGLADLRAWFATQVGGDRQPRDVLITGGGQPGLALAFAALAAPGCPVLMEAPTYSGALAAARAARLQTIPVPVDEHGILPDALGHALRTSGAKLVYCQPSFANPSGVSLTPDRRAAVLEAVAAAGAFLIEDDWTRHLALDGDALAPLARDDLDGHVVHVASLTKVTAPSLRVGAVVAKGPAAERIRLASTVHSLFVPAVMQDAALDLVMSSVWPRHLRALRAELARRRDHMVAALQRLAPELHLTHIPRGGLHMWVRLPDSTDDLEVAELAEQLGVLVYPGRLYFPAEPTGSFLRLSYSTVADPEDFEEGVRLLRKAVVSSADS